MRGGLNMGDLIDAFRCGVTQARLKSMCSFISRGGSISDFCLRFGTTEDFAKNFYEAYYRYLRQHGSKNNQDSER